MISLMRKEFNMIETIRLVNVQSFKDITFNFSSGVNVIEAPNETGKSIIFKVFRRMCDINWYGRSEKKALIRRGCERGAVAIKVRASDGNTYVVQFTMYKTYQTYKLLKDGELLGSWKQDIIPDEILNVMGWYYDFESMRLLNLLDQELEMPFVNNNNKSNYEIMKFITHDADLDIARVNLNQWIDELTRLESEVESRKMRVEGELDSLQQIDEIEIAERIEEKQYSLELSSVYANLIKGLSDCCDLVKPKFNMIDVDKIESSVDSSVGMYKFGKTLQEVLVLSKPEFNTVDENNVSRFIDSCKILNSMRYSIINLSKAISSKKEMEMKISNVKEHIEDFEKEHKFCPLCGNRFNAERRN